MEQAFVFASIIIAAAITDQIMSFHRLLRGGVSVRWHWAQLWFAALVLLLNVMIWWSVVGEPATGPLTIGSFLPTLIQLILLALLTISTLPDRLDPAGVDLAAYYQSNRRYQWGLLASTLVWSMGVDAAESLRKGMALVPALMQEGEDGVVLAVMIALAFVRNWWLVAAGLALLSLGPIHWLSRSLS